MNNDEAKNLILKSMNDEKIKDISEELKKDKLSDEKIREIAKEIDNMKNTDAITPEDLQQYAENLKDFEGSGENTELESVDIQVDENGHPIPVNVDGIDFSDCTDMDTFEKLCQLTPEQIKEHIDITKEAIESSPIMDFSSISDEDVMTLINCVNRYRKGEDFSYYNALPQSIKDMINHTFGVATGPLNTSQTRKLMAKELYDQIIQDNYINKISTDMQASIDKEYNKIYEETRGELKKYNDSQRDFFENISLQQAEKLREDGGEENIAKAETLEKSSSAFVESYTYESMFNKYKSGKIKIKKIDVEKFDSRCKEFDFKYKDNRFIINTVGDILPVLVKEFDGVLTEDQIKRFIILFIKYTMNMKPEVIYEHIFMYYFVKHLISIPYRNKDDEEECKFYDEIKDRIQSFIEDAF